MLTSDLDFDLPPELIATHPCAERGASRLLRVDCAKESWTHHGFNEITSQLRKGDLLVINNTKVVPARVMCKKSSGGRVEALFLKALNDKTALFMLSGGRLRPGVELLSNHGKFRLRLVEKIAPGRWHLEHDSDLSWLQLLSNVGEMPLPPYIRSRRIKDGEAEICEEDNERYQSICAKESGAVAAPTASLHLTPQSLKDLSNAGVEIAEITLHVGEGTFLPVSHERLEEHPIHSEEIEISDQVCEQLRQAKRDGRRVVALGTTVCRALESYAHLKINSGPTDLFITPGFEFKMIDSLITNFHTPKSTLLALVAAFAQHRGAKDGLELVKRAYAGAIAERYSFYSYGDSSIWQ